MTTDRAEPVARRWPPLIDDGVGSMRRAWSPSKSTPTLNPDWAGSGWRVPMSVPTYGTTEMVRVQEVLESRAVTQGVKVREFEGRFKSFVDAPGYAQALMVNSGSSANLLAAKLLYRLWSTSSVVGPPEVITPAVTWSTTVAPLIQCGFTPVFVDVDSRLQMDTREFERAITRHTFAVAPVHLAGWPADISEIVRIAREHRLFVWEDACESLGAKWQGRCVGTWGDMATFSFYFSHHLSTVEGGLLLSALMHQSPLAWREHGWTRGYTAEFAESIAEAHPHLDPRWVFAELGYNLRSTEMQAAMGLVQLERQAQFQKRRQDIAAWYDHHLQAHELHSVTFSPHAEPNPFSYPLFIERDAGFNARDLCAVLKELGVDSRPPMSGNITRHPWYATNTDKYRVSGLLPRANDAHTRCLLLPIHPFMSDADLGVVRDAVDVALRGFGSDGVFW